jgi:predicted nucleotidyltransferase
MITKEDLLKWLRRIDKKLTEETVITAVGGTAMTLLDLKESTRDVDFCVEGKYFEKFKRLAKSEIFVVDLFRGGYIFTLQLPDDYLELALNFSGGFKNLKLKILKLEDIVLTKTSRLNARDIEDIKALAKTGKVDVSFLKKRFREVCDSFAGREEDYKYHFELVLKMFS